MHTTVFFIRPVQTVPSAVTHLCRVDTAKGPAHKLAFNAKHPGFTIIIGGCSVPWGCKWKYFLYVNLCLFCTSVNQWVLPGLWITKKGCFVSHLLWFATQVFQKSLWWDAVQGDLSWPLGRLMFRIIKHHLQQAHIKGELKPNGNQRKADVNNHWLYLYLELLWPQGFQHQECHLGTWWYGGLGHLLYCHHGNLVPLRSWSGFATLESLWLEPCLRKRNTKNIHW